MYSEKILDPISIKSNEFSAQDRRNASRVTLAAYLLLLGPLFVKGVLESADDVLLPTKEQFEKLGIHQEISDYCNQSEFDYTKFSSVPDNEIFTAQYLAKLAKECNDKLDPNIAAELVASGIHSDNELIRVCALGSAVEFFPNGTINWYSQILWFLRNASQNLTWTLFHILLKRIKLFNLPPTNPPPPGRTQSLLVPESGLLAVHGTNFWDIPNGFAPPDGELFSYLRSFRPDIYGNSDYFRWEGGYSHYARSVASQNLFNWVSYKTLSGFDVVAHSHGCNVVMASTLLGAQYKKMVFLSCPVHWKHYYLTPPLITKDVVSIRVNVDIVILMDRGGQRFPPGTIKEHLLPFWFTAHNATLKPKNWEKFRLYKYLL